MLEKDLCRESKRPVILRDWLRYKAGFRRAHPDYFDPDGLAIFVGGQGTGKTLSAVNYVYKLLDAYPHAKLVTNVALADYPIVTFFEWFVNQDKTDFIKDGKFEMSEEVFAEYEQRYLAENRVFEFCDNDDFKRYSNGECGVIFFVDEIQLYMNSLESKNINIEVHADQSAAEAEKAYRCDLAGVRSYGKAAAGTVFKRYALQELHGLYSGQCSAGPRQLGERRQHRHEYFRGGQGEICKVSFTVHVCAV